VTPPKDHAFVIFDPELTNLDKIRNAIVEMGYDVKTIEEKN
jgi:copper chaperone CopZ